MADLKVWKNRDVRIVWTGPVTESRRIVQEDLDHYLGLIRKDRKLFYWDNTWHYHQPLRNFHAKYLPNFVNHCADRTAYVNINGTRPIGRFFSVTANDYYWNPARLIPSIRAATTVAQFMVPPPYPKRAALRPPGGRLFRLFQARCRPRGNETAISDLEKASLDATIPTICRAVYEQIAKERAAR